MERRKNAHKGAFRVIARRISYQLARSSVAYWRANGEKRGLIYVAAASGDLFNILCLEKMPGLEPIG